MIKIEEEKVAQILGWFYFKQKHYEKHPPLEQMTWLGSDVKLHNELANALEEAQKKKS